MLMPSKIVTPVDSLVYLSKFVLEQITKQPMSFDSLYESVSEKYPKKLSMEKFALSLTFLFIIGRLEQIDEVIKIKL